MQLIALETCPTRRAGGQELSLFETCRALSERGVTVTLLYAEPGDLLNEYAGFCQATYEVPSRYVSTRNWPRFLADVARTLWRTRTQGPTVVYGNRYFDLPFACALGRALRARVCCHLRVPAPPYLSRQYRLGMRLADACITTSHATRESYITRGAPADKLHVVPNGVDTDYFTPVGEASERIRLPGLPADAAVALFAGRLCADKGVDVLLDALARVRERGVNLHVVIAAPPARTTAERQYGHDLRMQADRLELSDCVHFTGHVADMVWLYHSVDVLVLPSRCEETFGRVLIEAMACGVPAVGSAVGGIPEVLAGEFAHGCVPSEDPAALAAVLAEQLDWRTRDPELAQRCRTYVVERFPQGKAMERVAAMLFPGGFPVMAGAAARNVRAEAECEACVL